LHTKELTNYKDDQLTQERLKHQNYTSVGGICSGYFLVRGKVYILLFNSYLKFGIKICTHRWNINKSHSGLLLCSLCTCI